MVTIVSGQARGLEASESVLYSHDFQNGSAAGWELDSGWRVVEYAPGQRALRGAGHDWATLAGKQWSDYRLRARLRLMRGGIHFNFRVSGPRRYFVGFQSGSTYLSRQNGPQDFQEGLASADRGCQPGRWYDVEISGQGGKLTISVDGTPWMQYSDASPIAAGGVAFETLDDSEAYVDDVKILTTAGGGGTRPPGRLGLRPGGQFIPETREKGWVRTGGPLGGLGYDIRMRPDNPNVMFVTDSMAGVFKSLDGGQTWFPSNGAPGGAGTGIDARAGDTRDLIPVFSLTIDPRQPDIVWVGTQHRRGIFKSLDEGQNWIRTDQGIQEEEGISFRGFTVDPHNSNIVYAAAELSSGAWAGHEVQGQEFDMVKGVVYKTTNGGAHWQRVWLGNNLARYVLVHPQNSNLLYVSTGIFDREAANSDPQSKTPGGVGIVKSTDGGQTWHSSNSGLHNLYVGSLVMHPDEPEVLLAGTGNNRYHEGAGVYLSEDGGDSWRRTLPDDIITSVEFSPADGNVAYAGSGQSIYRSEDRGRTWRRVSPPGLPWGPPGVPGGFPIDFQADPRDADRVFANAYGGGAFLSTDGGRTWTDASQGYTGSMMRRLVPDPTNAQRVYAGGRSGMFVTHDAGSRWEGLLHPDALAGDWNAVAVDPQDPRHLLAGNNWGAAPIHQTFDGGQTWRRVFDLQADRNLGWRTLVFAPSRPTRVYAGSGAFVSAGQFDNRLPARGVFASDDGGTTWFEANDQRSRDAHVTSLAVDPQAPMLVYAATTNRGMLKTSDGGRSWQIVGSGLPPGVCQLAVTVCPQARGTLYCGLERGALFRSFDAGQSWKPYAAGMEPNATVAEIVLDPRDPSVVYAADRSSGVYRLDPQRQSWERINQGLLNRAVNTLAFAADGSALYAGTEGNGVYRLDVVRGSGAVGRPPTEPQSPFEEPQEPQEPPGNPATDTLHVQVVGPDGRAIAGATVMLGLGEGQAPGQSPQQTGANGVASFRLPPDDWQYWVRVSTPSMQGEAEVPRNWRTLGRPAQVVVHPRESGGSVPPGPQTPPPGPPVTLSVVVLEMVPGGQTRRLVSGAAVEVRWAGRRQGQPVMTDDFGRANFQFPAENYEIVVRKPGYQEHREGVSLVGARVDRAVILRRE